MRIGGWVIASVNPGAWIQQIIDLALHIMEMHEIWQQDKEQSYWS